MKINNRSEMFKFLELSVEKRLESTFFLIEATHHEHFTLWDRWAATSRDCKALFLNWEQGSGNIVTVGYLNKQPVCVSLMWDFIEEMPVCFWEATSQVVDYEMINRWLDKHFTTKTKDGRRARANVDNFHHLTGEFDLENRPNFTRFYRKDAIQLLRQTLKLLDDTDWKSPTDIINESADLCRQIKALLGEKDDSR